MADKLEEVKHYWETHPLFSLEVSLDDPVGFFATVDKIKREDVEAFALPYWRFDAYGGKRVLDVGCGPGWVTVNYAANGAVVDAIDLTTRAVELTRLFLHQKQLTATVRQANAELLPFESNLFDLVVSCGVLHHTPNTTQAFRECFRVLKPGGVAKITLYRKGILHHPLVFPLTKLAMRKAGVRRPGADLAEGPADADAFIRQYDGADNPIGVGRSDREWASLLEAAGFSVRRMERHFFPKRFVPHGDWMPRFVHAMLDRVFGTMVYFDLAKT
jgi:SAM-dependent methyltransferase